MKHEAIYKLYPNVVVIRGDVAYDKDDNVVAYDEQLVDAETQKLAYIPARAGAYPALQEQLDMLWHDQQNGTSVWFDTIKNVKDTYPKP